MAVRHFTIPSGLHHTGNASRNSLYIVFGALRRRAYISRVPTPLCLMALKMQLRCSCGFSNPFSGIFYFVQGPAADVAIPTLSRVAGVRRFAGCWRCS